MKGSKGFVGIESLNKTDPVYIYPHINLGPLRTGSPLIGLPEIFQTTFDLNANTVESLIAYQTPSFLSTPRLVLIENTAPGVTGDVGTIAQPNVPLADSIHKAIEELRFEYNTPNFHLSSYSSLVDFQGNFVPIAGETLRDLYFPGFYIPYLPLVFDFFNIELLRIFIFDFPSQGVTESATIVDPLIDVVRDHYINNFHKFQKIKTIVYIPTSFWEFSEVLESYVEKIEARCLELKDYNVIYGGRYDFGSYLNQGVGFAYSPTNVISLKSLIRSEINNFFGDL